MSFLTWLSDPISIVALLVGALGWWIRLAALGRIPENRRPAAAMAWMIVIVAAPLTGLALFWLFGSTKLGRRRSARHAEVSERLAQGTAGAAIEPGQVAAAPYVRSAAFLNRRLSQLPMSGGNSVELIPDYASSLAAMEAAIDRAERYVYVEFYITAWDEATSPLFDAMVRATRRGVTVRLLFDHLGSRGIPGYKQMRERLRSTDIAWQPMLPIAPFQGRWRRLDLRNHRKILVVDGHVAFTGSQNLTEPGYNKPKNHKLGRNWVELMARLEGPVVSSLEVVFASDWYVETGEALSIEPADAATTWPGATAGVDAQIVPSGPGLVAENNLRLFNTLIYGAERRLSITSPYFVPDESLLYAVTTAAQRGVDVELFVSEESDQFMVGHAQASYYQVLLDAGVRIYLYPAPLILHSKHFSVDDEVAVIGSSNMDMRSFALNYEVSMMLTGREIVQRFQEVEGVYRSLSRELTPEEWRGRPGRDKYVNNVMRLTATLQ